MKTSVNVVGIVVKIGNRHLPNTNWKRNCLHAIDFSAHIKVEMNFA
jgi:hypothetical protein